MVVWYICACGALQNFFRARVYGMFSSFLPLETNPLEINMGCMPFGTLERFQARRRHLFKANPLEDNVHSGLQIFA